MNLDKEKIKKRFSEINEALEEIQELTSIEGKEFWAKKEHMAALKYYLLQAIEAVGSICIHIAAKKFNKGVSVFGECFEILSQQKLLEKDLTQRLRQMVKFRNKLIHRYWEIDDRKVLEYAKKNLSDFQNFIEAISKFL